MNHNIGFVGCGNMASAIINGIITQNILNPKNINIYDIDADKAKKLCDEIGAVLNTNLCEIENNSDIIFLCIKPNVLPEAVKSFTKVGKAYVSIAAGLRYEKILSMLPRSSRLLRIMPNTPLMAGLGASCFQVPSSLSDSEYSFVKEVFESLGIVKEVGGDMMDTVTGISGSGPAYVYYFIDAMAKAGAQNGLSYDDSLALTLQTIKGSIEMVKRSEKSVEQLKIDVCSPGGTTIEALKVFDDNNMDEIINNGIAACIAKSKKLSE